MLLLDWIEVIMLAIMAIGAAGVLLERLWSGRGIGMRVIQFTMILIILPAIVILTLEDRLDAGPLFGTVIGFVLGSFGKDETPKAAKSEEQQSESK